MSERRQQKRRDTDRDVWSKFFWSDWRGDERLGLCSYAARGLWMECLAIMAANHERPGYLQIAGAKPNIKELATVTRGHLSPAKKALAELIRRGVCSQASDGVIYSRRMVRDAARTARNRENGDKGGNPSLKSDNRDRDESRLTEIPPGSDKPQSHKPDPEPEARQDQPPRDERATDGQFGTFWESYPKREGKASAQKAWRKVLAAEVGPILVAVDWQARQPNWQKDGGQYIPLPATWLNGRRWDDERPTASVHALVAAHEDWTEECQRLHGGKCSSRYTHGLAS